MTIRSLERARILALMKRDAKAMDKLFATDLVHVTSSGKYRSKTQYMATFGKSKKKFLEFRLGKIALSMYNKIAVVTGNYTNVEAIGNTRPKPKNAWFARVYRKRSGNWQLIKHQATHKPN